MTTCDDEITMPGCWECPHCGFILTRSDLDIESGMVGPNDESIIDRCPNDGQILKPETWKSRCRRLAAARQQLSGKINDLFPFKPN